MNPIETKSQAVAADIAALLRARNPLIWIVTREEARVERHLADAASAAKYIVRTWDVAQGICNAEGAVEVEDSADPGVALATIRKRALAGTDRGLWIMRDLPVWLAGTPGAAPARMLRNLARLLPTTKREAAQAVIVLSPSGDVPAELAGHTTVIEWPLPDRAEIAGMLDVMIEQYGLEDMLKNGAREAAIDAAVGLSGEEAQACYARSLVQLRKIDPAIVAREKRRVIARERVLEWFDPLPGGLDSVGGLENLKTWLKARSSAYSPEARAYGLPAPKGALLVGISGCGKSLTAKAIATAWGVPLLRLDLNALKSKFVGESEGNLRRALNVIDAIGRCVVWLDEIEKALAGATQGAADGGVSADALGAVLTWMEERRGQAFIIATANDVSALPPELLRKGRFDEVWFVDLPTQGERQAILQAALRQHGDRAMSADDLLAVARATDTFTGSEIAALVPDALFAAFADGARPINGDDLLGAAESITPLAVTAKEKIDALRKWAATRARRAGAVERAPAPTSKVRALDI